jgi:hypothetical protein
MNEVRYDNRFHVEYTALFPGKRKSGRRASRTVITTFAKKTNSKKASV